MILLNFNLRRKTRVVEFIASNGPFRVQQQRQVRLQRCIRSVSLWFLLLNSTGTLRNSACGLVSDVSHNFELPRESWINFEFWWKFHELSSPSTARVIRQSRDLKFQNMVWSYSCIMMISIIMVTWTGTMRNTAAILVPSVSFPHYLGENPLASSAICAV